MKNTMKKLLSLVLVAMLLVSAIPFAASADGNKVHVKFEVNADLVEEKDIDINGTTARVGDLAWYHFMKEVAAKNPGYEYSFGKAWNGDRTTEIGKDDSVNAGDSIIIRIKCEKKTDDDTTNNNNTDNNNTNNAPAETKYSVKVVVKLNGDEQPVQNVEIKSESTTVADLIKYKVDASLIAGYDFDTAYTNASGYIGLDGTVNNGEKVYIAYKKEVAPIKIVVKVASSDNVVWDGEKVPANGKTANVADLLTYAWNKDWDDVYTVDHVWSHAQQKNVSKSADIAAGDTVYFMLKTKTTTPSTEATTKPTTKPTEETINKYPYDVYLCIFKDGKVSTYDKKIKITDGIAKDGLVTLGEVKNVVKSYYTAKDSDGIQYDGLYKYLGNWAGKFTTSYGVDSFDGLNEARKQNDINIAVMITNANAKTSGNADSSNPKTGDMIYVPMIFMLVSGAALAGVTVYNKKRIVK